MLNLKWTRVNSEGRYPVGNTSRKVYAVSLHNVEIAWRTLKKAISYNKTRQFTYPEKTALNDVVAVGDLFE